jgi:predicted CXXCH cytochrome family protein
VGATHARARRPARSATPLERSLARRSLPYAFMNATRLLLLAATLTLVPLLPSTAHATILSPEDTCLLRWARRSTTPATRCLQCHDGSAAKPIDHLGGGPSSRGSHPVGVAYAVGLARIPHLRPQGSLPAEIVLVNGELACTSCHDGRSSAPHKVAMPVGRLCTACHGQ